MTAQTVSSCVVCGATTDAFLCGSKQNGCLGRLLQDLASCAELVDELNVVLSRQSKNGGASVGFVTNGADEQPLPFDPEAMDVGLWMRDRMCSWARVLWEDNATREEDGSVPTIDLSPGIVPVSRWLMRHPTWIAIHPAVDELFREITGDIAQAWRVAHRSKSPRVYIGPCGAEHPADGDVPAWVCTDPLYGREDWTEVSCPWCETRWDVDTRRRHMLDSLADKTGTSGQLVTLATANGVQVTTSTIRSWVRRGRLTSVGVNAEGKPEYRVGDVLDVIYRADTRKTA